jgi:signal transduction histidine kinase
MRAGSRIGRAGDASSVGGGYRAGMTVRLLGVRQVAASPHLDTVAAVLASVAAAIEFWDVPGRTEGAPVRLLFAVVAGSLIGLPLAWRRRAPRASFTGVIVGISGLAVATIVFGPQPQGGNGPLTPFLVLLVSVFSFGAYGRRRDNLAGAVLAAAAFLVKESFDVVNGTGVEYSFWIALAIFWAMGRLFRERLLRVAELEGRTQRLHRDRETLAVAAVAEERSRIARELHDIVAHSVSLMVVQAGAARHTLDRADPDTAEALESIETTGRQALVELRRLLGILRRADDGQSLAPMPGLGQVEALAEQLREAGLAVELRTEGQPVHLAPGIDLAAYRILQEALTNALKHAGPAQAHVVLRYKPHELELEVVDDGHSQNPHGGGPGHGLVGMRERVSIYGGVLRAGPEADGGFAVRARLPLEDHRS